MWCPMRRRTLVLVPLAVLFVALLLVELPYFSEEPGPAREVTPLIDVSGTQQFESRGEFILTTVSIRRLTALGLVGAWVDPDRAVVPESAFILPGESETEADRRGISEMDQSKIDAAVVVLERLTGYPKERRPGVLVEQVVDGCPAQGRLFPGDLITSIDGAPVNRTQDVDLIADRIPVGEPLSIDVTAAGESSTVELTRRPCAGFDRPLIGINAVNNFPFPLTISSGEIGGPSAGIMWALGLYDLLTPGDLTGGRTVAGTGDIDLEGTVQPIGGVEQKVIAARASGADVFLVPDLNLQAARGAARGLEIVAVSDFQEALDYLLGAGGETTEPAMDTTQAEGTG
jgi:Lon-like protease